MNQQRLAAKGRIQELSEKIRRIDLEGRGNHSLLKSMVSGFQPWHELDLEVADEQLNRMVTLKKQRIELNNEIKRITEEFDLEQER